MAIGSSARIGHFPGGGANTSIALFIFSLILQGFFAPTLSSIGPKEI